MDVGQLISLWHDKTVRTEEVAKRLGISVQALYRIAFRNGLPRRNAARKRIRSVDDTTEMTSVDPTPEEIEARKAEVWEQRLRAMRCEAS